MPAERTNCRLPLGSNLAMSTVAATIMASAAVAATIRHDVADSRYLNRAERAQFDAVGDISFVNRRGQTYSGSGTLIAPNVVLTAAHITIPARQLSFSINGATVSGRQWVSHPGWNGNLDLGNDIGIVFLDRPVRNATPAVLNRNRNELGQRASIVGFGGTGTGLMGEQRYDGLARMHRNTVDFIENGKILVTDFDAPGSPRYSTLGSSTPLDLEGLVGSGDSGGGLFMNFGSWVLAGVTSYGQQGLQSNPFQWSDYGDLAGFTRVSSHLNWIDSVLRGTRSTAGADSYVNSADGRIPIHHGVPEPSVAALAFWCFPLVGAIGRSTRRRGAGSAAA
jgi:hypothetical protein